jgi:hypothetical protein
MEKNNKVWILTNSYYGNNVEILGVFSNEKLGLEIFNKRLEREKSFHLNFEVKYFAPTHIIVAGTEILLEEYILEEE